MVRLMRSWLVALAIVGTLTASVFVLNPLDLGYGTAEAMPDGLGIIRSLDSDKNSVHTDAADFGYVGSGRRCWMSFAQVGAGVGGKQDFLLDEVMELTNGQIGLLGLDPWGRAASLYYHPGNSVIPAWNFTYTYDLAGRRTAVTRGPDVWASPPTSGNEKQTDTYDDLDRLVGFKLTNSSASITRLEQDWELDLLGNWTERQTSTPNPDTWVRHFVDDRNRIEWTRPRRLGQPPRTRATRSRPTPALLHLSSCGGTRADQ